MRAREAISLLAVFATTSLSIAAAQVSSVSPQATDSHAVTVTFFVQDEHGNPVSTLQPPDLSVLDNGKPPVGIVTVASAKELPLRLGILIDNNPYLGVYYSKKQLQYEAAPKWVLDFVDEMLAKPEDKAFIASYSTIRHGTTFTSRGQIQPIDLNQFLKTDAPDFLGSRDAIRLACEEVFGADPAGRERRILIVVPGFDEAGRSLSDLAQTTAAAQLAGVKVFVSGWYGSPLQVIVSETGGYYLGWPDHTKSQIDSLYSLTYIPAGPYQSGKLRKLDVKITTNKNWRVYAPKRYLAPSTQ